MNAVSITNEQILAEMRQGFKALREEISTKFITKDEFVTTFDEHKREFATKLDENTTLLRIVYEQVGRNTLDIGYLKKEVRLIKEDTHAIRKQLSHHSAHIADHEERITDLEEHTE